MKGVGWVFTPRIPVRGIKAVRAAKKLTLTLPDGSPPTIGSTLTPVKTLKSAAKKPAKAAKTAVKVPKKAAKVVEAPLKQVDVAAKKLAKKSAPSKKTAAVKPALSVKKSAKAPGAPAKKSLALPAVALRRGRHPVNPEADFTLFTHAYRIGAKLEGEVTAFTSHGAVINVKLKGSKHVECYAPTASLGTPSPARARDVLKRGDKRTFKLVTVDSERRIAELALA